MLVTKVTALHDVTSSVLQLFIVLGPRSGMKHRTPVRFGAGSPDSDRNP